MNLKKFLFAFILLIPTTIFAADVDESDILVPSAVIMEINNDKILYEKNADQRMYPASTTKVMSAIIVLENCELDQNVTVTYSAISDIPEGYSTADLVVGEVLSVEQLLHLMLIESANDATNVLAEYVAGSEESFASLMNTKAHDLGCTNTNFVSSYGRHDDNHYSTAKDLYLIAKYAMQNDTFRSIVGKSSYILPPTNKHENERKVETTNRFLISSSDFYDKRVKGIKTGFTTPAGNCLISYASYNGIEVIAVALGGGLTNEDIPYQQYTSSQTLFNYVFDNYLYKTLYEQNSCFDTIEVKNASSETKNLKLLVDKDITVFADNETLSDEITPSVEMKDNILAPIKAGDVLGTINLNVFGIDYSANLIAANDVEVSPFALFVIIILAALLVIFILYKFIRRNRY